MVAIGYYDYFLDKIIGYPVGLILGEILATIFH